MKWILEALGIGGRIVDATRELKLARIQAETDIVRQQVTNQGSVEAILATNAQTSWSDEYMIGLLSFPYVLSFFPQTQHLVAGGFDMLATAPEWYKYGFLSAIGFVFAKRNVPPLLSWARGSRG